MKDSNPPAEAPRDEPDALLLRRFLEAHDDLAFAQLVTRHAPLVMGLCRRVLGREQDAEDAFQATFLVLARKAGALRRTSSLPAWLHKTAFRIALRARQRRSRRREEPLEAEAMIADALIADASIHGIAAEHGRTVLDEELNRLPEKYRLPLFLCCLEGKSREAAAEQLGWSSGSLKGRLERGRQLLRRRLILRGVSLSVALAAVASAATSAQASVVEPSLIAATVQAGMQAAAGQSLTGYVTHNALSLAHGSSSIMSLTSIKVLACCLTAAGLLVAGGWMLPAPAVGGAARELASGDATSEAMRPPVLSSAFVAEDDTSFVMFFDGDGERKEGQREGDAGPRRSAEGEQGPRRSAEGDAPRRSAEGDAPRRSAEGDGRQPAREGERRAENPLAGFRPQTQREAALLQMILQLQRDMEQLRRELAATRGQGARDGGARQDGIREGGPREGGARDGGARDGEGKNPLGPRDGDGQGKVGPRDGEGSSLAPGWEKTKNGKVFLAYDHNGDSTVTLDEWLAMKRVASTDTPRIQVETQRFNEAEPSGDGKFTPAEFLYWYSKGRFENLREGR